MKPFWAEGEQCVYLTMYGRRKGGKDIDGTWPKPRPKTELNSTRTTTTNREEKQHVREMLTGCGDTEHCDSGDSRYIVRTHLELFTTRIKQGPCVPHRLAD